MSKIVPARPVLVMLYGFPGAGKTYFARQLTEKFQVAHLQADRIRAELFEKPRYDKQENDVIGQLMDYMTGEFLAAGLSVVYDVSAMRLGQRRLLRDLARKHHAQPILVWLQIDGETAFLRGQKRDRRKADDKFAAQLSSKQFENIAGHMQNPAPSEDYVVVSGKQTFNTQFSAVMRRLRELGVVAPTSNTPGVAKPGLVNLGPNPAAGRVDMSRRQVIIR